MIDVDVYFRDGFAEVKTIKGKKIARFNSLQSACKYCSDSGRYHVRTFKMLDPVEFFKKMW